MAHALRSGPAQDCDLVKPINTIPISTIDEYDADKAVHCLVYVLKKLGGVADLYTLLKIIYFADKRHLERYGRFLFGDSEFSFPLLLNTQVGLDGPWSAFRRRRW